VAATGTTTIPWPGGKRFAFTVFDDTDRATLENVGPVYRFLDEMGFRTTKSCWPVSGAPDLGEGRGATCEDRAYLEWLLDLQRKGFEIGWHSSTWHGLPREETIAALDRFAEVFGHDPVTAAHHSSGEGVYWGDGRVSGLNRLAYNLITRFRQHGQHRGHVPGDPFFWGDVCRRRIKYYRNFVFADINTLKACPWMPYFDPDRPFVRYWYASSEGARVESFNECLSEASQDRLEAEGGACIMYTHFANGFFEGGTLDKRFERLMERLSSKNGWFVPVGILLDHLLHFADHREISGRDRARLERKWLFEKLFLGTR
jgi:hypothetical protein